MKNFRLFIIILAAGAVCSCGGLKRMPAAYYGQPEPAQREQRVLYPVGSDADSRIGESSREVPTEISYVERPMIHFSESESAHVRISGINPIPEDGLALNLDELVDEFCYPYKGKFISDYGMRGRSFHTGVDIKAIPNDTIRAAFDGVVRMSKLYSSYGNIVVIRHYAGFETVYSHASKNLVAVNDVVRAGDPIQLAGRTGRATTEHLHFEVRAAAEHIDPKLMIDCDKWELRPGMLYIKKTGGTVVAARGRSELEDAERAALQQKSINDAAQTAARAESQKTTESSPAATSTNAEYYRVKKGDTLYAISRRYNTTVKKLCELNGIKENSTLQINQRLRVK